LLLLKKAAALYTPETLAAKAAEVRRLLSRAVIAFGNPDVLDSVTRLALAHPEIAWEPVALAAAALNAQRDLDEAKARAADPLLEKVSLPQAPTPSAGVGGFCMPPNWAAR